jgi:hypothetical protein
MTCRMRAMRLRVHSSYGDGEGTLGRGVVGVWGRAGALGRRH